MGMLKLFFMSLGTPFILYYQERNISIFLVLELLLMWLKPPQTFLRVIHGTTVS
uniref:Uncharacterized protein n=1 Tax=Arundo donax TaxID=35708 RepID=A0A0A9CYA5_ARUDO